MLHPLWLPAVPGWISVPVCSLCICFILHINKTHQIQNHSHLWMETSRENSAAAALLWVIGQSFVQVKENTAALPAKQVQNVTPHCTKLLAGKWMKLSILSEKKSESIWKEIWEWLFSPSTKGQLWMGTGIPKHNHIVLTGQDRCGAVRDMKKQIHKCPAEKGGYCHSSPLFSLNHKADILLTEKGILACWIHWNSVHACFGFGKHLGKSIHREQLLLEHSVDTQKMKMFCATLCPSLILELWNGGRCASSHFCRQVTGCSCAFPGHTCGDHHNICHTECQQGEMENGAPADISVCSPPCSTPQSSFEPKPGREQKKKEK